MRGGPRGIAKDVVKSQTTVYHFTAAELRKRLKLPESAKFSVDIPGANEQTPAEIIHVEVKS